MEVCVVNWWETFKGWTPFIVATVVYFVWHKQKGKEVIANEAKEYIYNLNKLESIQTEIETISTSAIRKKELLEEYILYKAKASNHANFLGKACPKDLTLSNLSTTYSAQCIRYIWLLKDSKIYEIKNIPDPDDAYLLIEHLLIYALYKNGSIKSKILSKLKGYYHA